MSTPNVQTAPLTPPAEARPLPIKVQVGGLINKIIEISNKLSSTVGPENNLLYDNLAEISQVLRLAYNVLPESPVVPSLGTTVACTKCGRLDAPVYYLKHQRGFYGLLCFDNGNGCWERSAKSCCSYVDQFAAQCPELAEWVVTYGEDGLKQRDVCALHVPAVLSDVGVHRIYPLKD